MIQPAIILVQPQLAEVLQDRGVALATLGGLFLVMAWLLLRSIGGASDWAPFAYGLALVAVGLACFGITIYPDVVPFRLSLWDASSSPSTQLFLLCGAGIVTPVILAYSAFAYRVFRGRTPAAGWEQ